MIDNLFLNVVRFFNPFFERVGVDTYQLNEILRVKLLIDRRRPASMFTAKRRTAEGNITAKATGLSFWVVFFTLLMGAFYGLVLFIFPTPMVGQALYFGIFMMLMSLTLITDFTNVLMNTRDQYIILPRPVNDSTASVARILHITIYVLRLAFLQSLAGTIMIGFIDGIMAVPVFVLQVIEATLFCIFLVNIIYLGLMRSVSPQRVKDIVSYFQIAFSIIIFGIARMPSLFKMSDFGGFSLLHHVWAYFLPPVWFAALNETLIHASRANYIIAVMAFLGIAAPVAGIWLVAKVLAPGFNRILAIMASSDGASSSVKIKGIKRKGLIDKAANFLCPDPVENAGFRITWKLAARMRDFKMRVYPSFAYMPVYFGYLILRSHDRGTPIGQTRLYVILLYVSIFMISLLLQNVALSEKFKSSWVYYALPIYEPGKILGGMYKALITIYFVPYYLIVSIVTIAIWGPSTINDIILAFFLNQIIGILMALFLVKGLPFSRPVLNRQAGGKGLISLFILAFAGAIGFGHYVLAQWEGVITACAVVAAVLNWVMYRYYRKQTWDSIELADLGE